MRFRIHFTYPDGTEDSVVIEGDDLEALQAQAKEEVKLRNGSNPWSEEI